MISLLAASFIAATLIMRLCSFSQISASLAFGGSWGPGINSPVLSSIKDEYAGPANSAETLPLCVLWPTILSGRNSASPNFTG